MLPRKNLINKRDFKDAFIKSKPFIHKYILLKKSDFREIKEPQFAIVFSKKVEKLAVKRNKSRRVFSSALKIALRRNTLTPGFYIFIVQKSILDLDFEKIVEDIDFIIKKATI